MGNDGRDDGGMSDQPNKPLDVVEHLDKINALPTHFEVTGTPGSQLGLPHLRFRCPRCNVPAALSAPGKYLCPHCASVLNVRGG